MKKDKLNKKFKNFIVILIVVVALHCVFIGISIERNNDKLWLHRVNSLEKLEEQSQNYQNFEVDVTIRESGACLMDVTHDTDTTFGLSLDRYFEKLRNNDRHLWLDIKNLSSRNRQMVMNHLDSLCLRYHVDKRRLILESPDYRSLGFFTRKGWYTSCYLTFQAPDILYPRRLVAIVDSMNSIADSKSVRAISFCSKWYPYMAMLIKNDSVDLLAWRHHSNKLQLLLYLDSGFMLNDKQIKVVLLKNKGKYHR